MHGTLTPPRRDPIPAEMVRGGPRVPRIVAAAVCALLLTVVMHLVIGTVPIGVVEALNAVIGQAQEPLHERIVVGIRLPRVLVVVTAGAMLGLAGAILQSITRNPLAEPGLLGVTGGAVLAIVCVIILASKLEGLGMVEETGLWLGLVGVAGGLSAGAATFALAWRGSTDSQLLVLMGVLVAGTLAALAALVLLNADENQVRLVLHWTIGSTNGRVWAHWHMLWPFAVTGLAAGLLSAGLANALQLGDGVATGLGLPVERVRLLLLFVAAWLTAGAVAVVGGIGFVGLIGPHVARRLAGSDARKLFPAAALASALLLLSADLVARTLPLAWLGDLTGLPIAGAAGLPVGVVMPVLGVPFFLWLLVNHDRMRT